MPSPGGLPDQTVSPESTAVFTDAYAVIPASVQRDIVTSLLPGWVNTRAWVLARPLTGFAETFAQYAVELAPKGGSDTPEPDAQAQAVLFVATGRARLTLDGQGYDLVAGSYAYIPLRPNGRFGTPAIRLAACTGCASAMRPWTAWTRRRHS